MKSRSLLAVEEHGVDDEPRPSGLGGEYPEWDAHTSAMAMWRLEQQHRLKQATPPTSDPRLPLVQNNSTSTQKGLLIELHTHRWANPSTYSVNISGSVRVPSLVSRDPSDVFFFFSCSNCHLVSFPAGRWSRCPAKGQKWWSWRGRWTSRREDVPRAHLHLKARRTHTPFFCIYRPSFKCSSSQRFLFFWFIVFFVGKKIKKAKKKYSII